MAFDRANLVREAVLKWFGGARRDLPWRRTSDAYAIWVSEVMLQQTRVETVIPYFERFLLRFPTLTDLANATPDEVRAEWSGLGYYRRAALMHRAAIECRDRWAGALPNTFESLSELPGFGPYTAGAVAAIAFGEAVPAVDGNVARVLARVLGVDAMIGDQRIKDLAKELSRGPDVRSMTEGLIELGAIVCTPTPRCDGCPIKDACEARKLGIERSIPSKRARTKNTAIALSVLVHVQQESVLLERRPESGIFGGMWMLPILESVEGASGKMTRERERTARGAAETIVGPTSPVTLIGSQIRHVLTHRTLHTSMFLSRRGFDPGDLPPSHRMVPFADLRAFGLPSFVAKVLEQALSPGELLSANLLTRATGGRSKQR